MQKRVKNFIIQHALIAPEDSILLAVSGGPDSMALLHLLAAMREELSFDLAAVTIEHHLRETQGRESRLVGKFCDSIGVDHATLDINTSPPHGESLENWARRERYALLESHAERIRANRIALGHTADDQVETFFIRLIRGTGLRGLRGMQPLARGRLIRPLLEVRREEITAYISKHTIPTLIDESNASDRFLRNRIRNHLLPLLKDSFSPAIASTILKTQHLLKEDDACLSAMARQWLGANIHQNTLPLMEWRALPSALRVRVLLGFLTLHFGSPISISAEQILHVESGLLSREDAILPLTPKPFLLVSECDTIHLVPDTPRIEHPLPLTVPGITPIPALSVSVRAIRDGEVSASPWVCGIRTDTRPLTVTTRRGGEITTSEEGHRTVKKILKESGIPRHQRRNMPLVAAGRDVIWIPGVYAPAVSPDSDHITLRWEPWKP